jgi:hypothetical protein
MANQLESAGTSSSQLTLLNGQAQSPTLLTASEFEVLKASTSGSKIGDMHPETLILFVVNLMNQAKIRLGHTSKFNDSKEVLRIITDDLRKRFHGFTTVEVTNAIDRGLNGEFRKSEDELLTFTPSLVFQWIRTYKETVKEPVVKKSIIQKAKEETPPEPTLAEQNAMLIKGFLVHYEKMKADPAYIFQDYGNAYYNFLTEIGIEMATLEEKKAMYAEELEKEKNAAVSDLKDIKAKNKWMEMVEANLAREQDNPFEFRIKSRCKRRALAKYLKASVEFGMELSEIIAARINP